MKETIQRDSTNYFEHNTFTSVDQTQEFIEKFKNLCVSDNLNEDYNLEQVELINTNQNFFITYFQEGSVRSTQSYVGYDYDKSNCTDNKGYDCNYIILTDNFILNKTEEHIYYMYWYNDIIPLRSQNNLIYADLYERLSFINNSTIFVVTNLNYSTIKAHFNFDFKFNPFKVKNIEFEFNKNVKGIDDIINLKFLPDSSYGLNSYSKYSTKPKK